MAHVAVWKKDTVNELVQDMSNAPVVAVVDVENIPGQQYQAMRAGLRGHAKLRMTKNKLMRLAIQEVAKTKPGFEDLGAAVDGQCAIITTDMDSFKLYKQLKKTMTASPAKPGQIAPTDIIVHAGPTPFGPGPIIGDLQKIGLSAQIDGSIGKIVVKKDATLVKAGEPIPANVAAMLPKLEILPMIVGLDLRMAYEDGVIYKKDVLDIPDDYYSTMFATAAHNALALGVSIAMPTKQTINPLITKAYREAFALSVSAAIPTKENIDMLLAKAEAQMLSLAMAGGYTSDAIAAKAGAAAAAAVAAAPVAAAPAESVKEEEQEAESSAEEAAAGLSALFD